MAIIDSRFADQGLSCVATRYFEAGIPVVLLNADPVFSAPALLGRVRMLAKPHSRQNLIGCLATLRPRRSPTLACVQDAPGGAIFPRLISSASDLGTKNASLRFHSMDY
ncbi:MAG: hypothetical protein O9322_14730 [Beijerinckiaceae bacterium]|nr:hypothetical protein [Beijerinckiaceae bacterium]MCZ8300603.1 hypothetical protein [Beijerinckiaceae bacterium]